MPEDEKKLESRSQERLLSRVKFEIYGEEIIVKRVNPSGNSGRIYLPANWVGRQVKVVRID